MGIGESSPAVSDGLVFVGDLAGVLHAVDAATGEAVWTYQTDGESQVLARHHRRRRADRLVRRTSVRHYRADRRADMEVRDAQLRACDPGGRRRRRVLRRLRRGVPGRARERRRGGIQRAGRRLHRGLADHDRQPRLLRNVQQRGDRHRPLLEGAALALRAPATPLPVLFVRPCPWADPSSSAAGTGWCTRSTRPPAKGAGLSGRARGSTRPPPPPATACSSARATDASTCSTWRPARICWDFDTGAPLSASPAIADGKVVIGSQDGVLYCFG